MGRQMIRFFTRFFTRLLTEFLSITKAPNPKRSDSEWQVTAHAFTFSRLRNQGGKVTRFQLHTRCYSHCGLTRGSSPVRAKEGQSKTFENLPQMVVSFYKNPQMVVQEPENWESILQNWKKQENFQIHSWLMLQWLNWRVEERTWLKHNKWLGILEYPNW